MSLADMILYHCIHTLLDFPRSPTTDSHLSYKKYGVRIFRRPLGNPPPLTKQRQSQQEDAPVTVDTRVLIDKVLSRYSGEFTVFRELLQNSDDAGCDAAEIRFETAGFLGSNSKAAANVGPAMLPDLRTTNVQNRLAMDIRKPREAVSIRRSASGNPDPQKVGAFGVGSHSLFSVTESPYVSSGGRTDSIRLRSYTIPDKQMKFSWKDENQLCYRTCDSPRTDLWTTFKMPLREAAPMPPISQFMQFLSSSITFVIHLKNVTVFFDHHRVGQIHKSLGQSQVIPIPTELKRQSSVGNMTVDSVQQYGKSSQHLHFASVTIEASIMPPQCDSMRMHGTKVELVLFAAEVDVIVSEKLSKELKRCMKKYPPSRLEYSLIYMKYDQSCINEQKHAPEFPSAFRGLRADLDGAIHTRVFIGHATAQTTDIVGHMASCFIPTVERECIDLVNVTIWNRESLYVGGFLCRVVYELELSDVHRLWKEAATDTPQSPKLHDQYFLHLLKFFTVYHSTPSVEVTEWLAHSFYNCSIRPLKVLSSVGILEGPGVRAFDRDLAEFLKSFPILSEDVVQMNFIEKLPDQHKIRTITVSHALEYLRLHPLGAGELVACLR
ncbi:hypothetical protein EDD16DRAFT_1721508 [Pisolithus croceorrhizus]|nr:hypothetical protein EDD16DRAFT_1721508 [Pisolithus croceorrhizus]